MPVYWYSYKIWETKAWCFPITSEDVWSHLAWPDQFFAPDLILTTNSAPLVVLSFPVET
jgi:hypothetical protein